MALRVATVLLECGDEAARRSPYAARPSTTCPRRAPVRLPEFHYPFDDEADTMTVCGRIGQPTEDQPQAGLAGQTVSIKRADDHLWLVSFMHYDLGYFEDEVCRFKPVENPLGPKR